MDWISGIIIALVFIFSSVYFYYLGARNEARWQAKKQAERFNGKH